MLKAGDKVYRVYDLCYDEGKFSIESAIVNKVTAKQVYLTAEDGRAYPGLAFCCKSQWPIHTPFHVTRAEACVAYIDKLEEDLIDAKKEVVHQEKVQKKFLVFADKVIK